MKARLFFIFFFLIISLSQAQNYGTGMLFDDAQYKEIPEKAELSTRSFGNSLPASFSLKKYAPIPKSQGQTGTCVAWATAYAARTIVEAEKNNWTDKNLITSKAFSPGFLYKQIKQSSDYNCQYGSYIDQALTVVKSKGLPYYSTANNLCYSYLEGSWFAEAQNFRIQDFAKLFALNDNNQYKIQRVKKSLSEGNPVIFGMLLTKSFYKAEDLWKPTETPANSIGGHAMAVIGYDDNKYGGAFEIQNSWGTNWGNKGYTWIRYYDFTDYVKYAYEMVNLGGNTQAKNFQGTIEYILSDGTLMKATKKNGLYEMLQAYSSGTKFRIYISNRQPAFVYALGSDATQAVFKLFPYNQNISAALNYSANEVPIPDESHFIQMDNTLGNDYLCVIFSKNKLDIDLIIKEIKKSRGSFSEKVQKVLQKNMIAVSNINFQENSISFNAKSAYGSIAILMVKIKHIP